MDISTTEVQKPSGEFGIQIPMIALFVLISLITNKIKFNTLFDSLRLFWREYERTDTFHFVSKTIARVRLIAAG